MPTSRKPRQTSTTGNISPPPGAPSPGHRGYLSAPQKKSSGLSRKNPASTAYDPPERISSCISGKPEGSLHWRLHELRHTLQRGELMPWNEPMTEAPALWAWQDAEGLSYRVLCCTAGRFTERKTGDAELSPLPVPAGTRRINALQCREVPPAVQEIYEPEGKQAGRETRRRPPGQPGGRTEYKTARAHRDTRGTVLDGACMDRETAA